MSCFWSVMACCCSCFESCMCMCTRGSVRACGGGGYVPVFWAAAKVRLEVRKKYETGIHQASSRRSGRERTVRRERGRALYASVRGYLYVCVLACVNACVSVRLFHYCNGWLPPAADPETQCLVLCSLSTLRAARDLHVSGAGSGVGLVSESVSRSVSLSCSSVSTCGCDTMFARSLARPLAPLRKLALDTSLISHGWFP